MAIVNWGAAGKEHGWLDEGRIIPSSYSFVTAYFGPIAEDPIFTVSTDYHEYLDGLNDNGSYVPGEGWVENDGEEIEWSAAIVNARIEGDNPVVRRAKINMIDPTGNLAIYLAKIGLAENNPATGNQPNVKMVFGWKNLKPKDGKTELHGSLDGMVLKAAEDITPEGVFTAEIEVLEFSFAKLDSIKFLDKYDMEYGLPERIFENIEVTTDSNTHHEKATPQKVLEYVISDTFSVGRALNPDNFNIKIEFKGGDKTTLIDKSRYPKIRFGDFLHEYISDVVGMVAPTDDYKEAAADRKKVVRYVKQQPRPGELPEDGITIIYDWEEIVDPDAQGDVEEGDAPVTYPTRDSVIGPSLVWRKMVNGSDATINTESNMGYTAGNPSSDYKMLLSWQTDLASHNALIHIMQEQLSDKLSGISDADWDTFLEEVEKKGLDRYQNKVNNVYERRNIAEKLESKESLSDRLSKFQRGNEMFEIMDTYGDDKKASAGGAIDALRAVILVNAFTATATVLGDPTLGTIFESWETLMPSYFDNTNVADYNLSSILFDRMWSMKKTTHVFEEGNYTTEIQLMGLPPALNED